MGESRRDVQKVKDKLHLTPTSSPFVYKGKVEGIEHKVPLTL